MRYKISILRCLTPLFLVFGVALAHPALAYDLHAPSLATHLSDALVEKRLPEAQMLVDQMASCGVKALHVDGVEYPLAMLNTTITTLARGRTADNVPMPQSGGSLFLLDTLTLTAGVTCPTSDNSVEVAAIPSPATPPAEPPAPPPTPPQPPAPPEPPAEPPLPPSLPPIGLDSACVPFEAVDLPCLFDPDVIDDLTPEEVADICDAVGLGPDCPFLDELPDPPQPPPTPPGDFDPCALAMLPPGCLGEQPPEGAAGAASSSAATESAGAISGPVTETLNTVLAPTPPVVSGVVDTVTGLLNL